MKLPFSYANPHLDVELGIVRDLVQRRGWIQTATPTLGKLPTNQRNFS